MSRIDNLSQGNLKRIISRIERLELAAPLSNSSIGRGRMRFYDGSVLLIENGALQVTGTATISGVLSVSGQTNLTGQTSITGPLMVTGTTTISGNTSITGELVVTGPTTLDGVTEIGGDTTITGKLDITGNTKVTGQLEVTGAMSTKGTLSVEGVTTLKNDLNVTSGGKIKAGNLEIEPANGGQINFQGGAIAVSGTFGLGINHNVEVSLTAPAVRIPLSSKPASQLTPIGVDSNNYLHRIS